MADRDPLVVWGVIERLYSSHRLLVRSDDDKLYSVRASEARIERTGGDLGRWDDLRIGEQVDVFGIAQDDRSVDASHIRITGGRPTDRVDGSVPDDRYRQYPSPDDRSHEEPYRRSQDAIEVLGTVSSIDRDRESIRLRTRRGLRTVELFDETRMQFDSGRSAALRDVRVGDEVSVRGVDRGDRIVADRVTLLGPSESPYSQEYEYDRRRSHGDVVLNGTVRGSTYYLRRRITVRTAEGDVTVEVDRDTPIYELDDRISVHELESGDRVRIVGRWTASDHFLAKRIAVTPHRNGGGTGL
jgi:hypothetical protein